MSRMLFAWLAACSSSPSTATVDALVVPPVPDAAPTSGDYDLSCLGNAPPTTAEDPITIGGTAGAISPNGMSQTLANVAIDVCSDAGSCAHVTSDSSGKFSGASLASGGAPLDLHLSATLTGYRPTRLYFPAAVARSQPNVPVLLLTPITFALLANAAGITPTHGDGTIVVGVLDCQNKPIAGATVTVRQGGHDVGTQFSAIQRGVIVFNVPPGATEVSASYQGNALLPHTVDSVADADITTAVRPGY